jgi:tetratricopeptide (TPR) repeat protein
MGNIYFRTGHFDQAAAAYEQLLSHDVENVLALTSLGQVYFSQQRPDEAIGVLEKAIELDAEWMPAHQGLAEVFKSMGEIARSEEHRARVRQLKEEQ